MSDLIERLNAKGHPRRPNGVYTVCGQLQGHAYIGADPDCAAAAAEIERLRAQNEALITDKVNLMAALRDVRATPAVTEHHRLREAALTVVRNKWTWEHRWSEATTALPPLTGYTDDAWRPFEEITATDGQWFVWRDPDDKAAEIHADRAIVEDGKIVGKDGCGLQWFVDCQPCRFADDVVEALKGVGQWPEDAP